GIANVYKVRVFNDSGEVRLHAKFTPLILTGVSAIGLCECHNADIAGDKIDHAASINTLTTLRPSPQAKGNPQHKNLLGIEKN
ncbi:dimethyl sulfoxide reductase subunit A, partial [Salmonella enterica subsp. enterica serovar Infantis]